ncbi:MAG TPA: hypothetical protein VFY56_10390 [Propionibacteriaceae bacterium]|nr:hypothetical protein [Propionibacteriaceae bacterium]
MTTPKLPPPPRNAQNKSGLVVGVDADLPAVGREKLDRSYPVTGKAVPASVEAQAAAERVPSDADVGRLAVEGRKAKVGCARHDVFPEGAGAHPGAFPGFIDLNAAPASSAQQHGIGERAERCCKMPSALCGNALAVGGRGTDHIADFMRATWDSDAGGLLVDQDIESPTLQIPVGICLVSKAAMLRLLQSSGGLG